MDYHTLSGNSKVIKMLQNFASGNMQVKGNVPCVAVVDSVGNAKLTESVVAGIKSKGGVAIVQPVPSYGFLNKINPMTARYATSFQMQSATTIDAIIKTNMLDGVVIISDCEVTASGLMLGALRCNCPALVCNPGFNPNFDLSALRTNKVSEDTLFDTALITGFPNRGITFGFFAALESLGFNLGTHTMNSGRQLDAASKTGEKAVEIAKDLALPKRFFTKDSFSSTVQVMLEKGFHIDAMQFLLPLFNFAGVKTPHEYIGTVSPKMANKPVQVVLCKGSAASDGGYAHVVEGIPTTFKAKAWVYQSVEEADIALSKGTVPANSVVVVHAFGENISSLINTIRGLGMEKEIAVATDGVYCGSSAVLVLSCCRPSSLDNEDFANIQTGDVLDINTATGRFNTSISAKDMKVRAKKNGPKKQQQYFTHI